MNYDEIVKALKEVLKLDEQILSKRKRNGSDLDSLDGIFD